MSIDTRLQLGRAVAERFRLQSLDLDGDTISLSGIFRCDTLAEQKAVRDQFVGYGPHNPDEEVVPFALGADETLSGYVAPVKVSAEAIQATLASGDDDRSWGWQSLRLELIRVAATQFEIVCDGDDRDTAHEVTPWSWVGLPLRVDVDAGPTALAAADPLDVDVEPLGSDGYLRFARADSGSKGDLYDDTVMYSVASDGFYGGAVVLEVTDDQPLYDRLISSGGDVEGRVASTGQVWHGNAISPIGSTTLVPASMPVVADGLKMEIADTAGYSWPDELPFEPDSFVIEFVLTEGTTDGAEGAFIVSSVFDDTDPVPIALNSVHLIHNRLGVQMYWNDGGIDPAPVTHLYASPLTADGKVVHRLKMEIDRDSNKVWVTDPDGTRTAFASPKASDLWGSTVLVENICHAGTFSTDRFVRYLTVKVDTGRRWRTVVGRRMPDRPNGWRLRNSLVEVSPDARSFGLGGEIIPDEFAAISWYRFRAYNSPGWDEKVFAVADPAAGARVSVECLRNAPEAGAVRCVIDDRVLEITLRRGAWWVEGRLSIEGQRTDTLGIQVAPIDLGGSDGEDGTEVTGGLDAAAADDTGNKYRLRSPNAIAADTDAGVVALADAGQEFWFGFGLDIGDDFTPYYFAAMEHLQRPI